MEKPQLPLVKVFEEIRSCNQCRFKKEANPYSTDGWDHMIDWQCSLSDNKKIQGAVEWHEEDKIPIPDWCPRRVA